MSRAVGKRRGRHWATQFGAVWVALSLLGVAHAQSSSEKTKTSDKARTNDKSKARDKARANDKSKTSDKARASDKSTGDSVGASELPKTKGKGKGKGKTDEVKVSENASRRFSQGVRYLTSQDPGRYEKAYREFKAAYADSPSWKILGNLGIAAQELERDGEAILAFESYLEQGGKVLAADERKQFKEDLEVLRAGSSTVTIETQPEGAWIVDERLPETGEPIVNRYGPTSGKLELKVRAGRHRIVAQLNGYEDATWEFSDPPGGSSAHRFELEPPRPIASPEVGPPPVEAQPGDVRLDSQPGGSSALRTTAYVALGLGLVGGGLGTYFLLDAFDKRDRADSLFADCEAEIPGCPREATLRTDAQAAERAEGSAFKRSMLTYAAGGALAATGVVLFLVSSPSSSEDSASREAAITPWVSPEAVGISGHF
jgi:hypothetical protein